MPVLLSQLWNEVPRWLHQDYQRHSRDPRLQVLIMRYCICVLESWKLRDCESKWKLPDLKLQSISMIFSCSKVTLSPNFSNSQLWPWVWKLYYNSHFHTKLTTLRCTEIFSSHLALLYFEHLGFVSSGKSSSQSMLKALGLPLKLIQHCKATILQ